ncbi:ABC transporter permease [Chitinophaga sancti]|uniref:ABC transporter permease n=1 Tax=Chitinophaga sancti TaxID=1004 RepID=A0A1K1MGY8_9BACT|nr:ABC transporter permease [Chitinophaga sancti]WQD62677.1 ABC transporter permease [Chitinophaga sancti]WQG91699.1 ABC transporter permease [Chitinophaga sancti]SFW22375.1 MacB-like core domain-containing protein [Chitinophaga sancti]
MFNGIFTAAWRNLRKDRLFTLLNLLGLSTGLACALLIFLWVRDEKQINHFNTKDDRLYQILVNLNDNGQIATMDHTQGLLAQSLKNEVSGVEYAASVLPASWFRNSGVLTFGDNHLKAGGQFISKDFFDVFTCRILYGNALADKQSIMISDRMAQKLFPQEQDAIGKSIHWEQGEFSGDYGISGVFQAPPANATEQYDLLLDYQLVLEKREGLTKWYNFDPSTFIIVNKDADITALQKRIKDFVKTKDKETGATLLLTKYSDFYLYNKYENGKQSGGRIAYVKLFSLIALFILIIACINFMNLSTAKAATRVKEVGVKKVVGASRGMLILQYLSESVLLSMLALLLAVGLIICFLPIFNHITGKQLQIWPSPSLALSFLGITILTGVVAGSYPALYLSGFKPALALKGKLRTAFGEVMTRKGLVIFQFVLSVSFIIAILIVYKQMQYIQNRNLGYNRSNLVHFEVPTGQEDNMASFLDLVKNQPGIQDASSYNHDFTGNHGGLGGLTWLGKTDNTDLSFSNLEVGYGFLEIMGVQLKEGRYFSRDSRADNEIIFNETAIREMGIKDPIGKSVRFWGREKVIIGIAKDFNYESLYETVKPAFFQSYKVMPNFVVKIAPGKDEATMQLLKKLYEQHFQGLTFDYKYVDEDYQAMYASERRVSDLSRYFGGLTILISCLGLFGLAAFTAQRRQKEIGIRKVIGASTGNIVRLLSADYFKLIGIAMLIAFPLAGWMMFLWLQTFAYRIQIGADVYCMAGIATLLITFTTIGYQSIKAAFTNPVKSLQAE